MTVPIAHVINLDRCTENWELMKTTWASIFDLQRVSAIDGSKYGYDGKTACRMSHIRCLKELAVREEPYQIVLEDDVYPTSAFAREWPAIYAFLESGRDDWDFITLDPIVQFERPSLYVFTSELFTTTSSRASGGTIYRTTFLKENIDSIEKIKKPLDMTMTHNPKFRKLIPQHLIMRQRAGKPSTVSGKTDTSYYNDYYSNTEAYLEAARAKINRPHDLPVAEST